MARGSKTEKAFVGDGDEGHPEMAGLPSGQGGRFQFLTTPHTLSNWWQEAVGQRMLWVAQDTRLEFMLLHSIYRPLSPFLLHHICGPSAEEFCLL